MLSIALGALGLVAEGADAQEAGDPREMMVEIREPVGMSATVYLFAGSCGRDRYETELRGSDRPGESSTFSLRVNGHLVAPAEMARIEAAVPEGFAFDRAIVRECPREVRQARIMLTLGGTSSPELRSLSFLVGADGRVTGIK